MSGLGEQFARPKGLLGALAGRIMARSNRELGAWAVSLLDPGPEDRVLEVGFGPGMAARMVLEWAPGGFLLGVDASEEMVRQATKRNARAVNEGRADLRRADVSELLGSGAPFGRLSEEPFDGLLSINSVPFWDERVACLRGLRGLLRGGGLAVLAAQPRTRGATGATTREVGEGLTDDLLAAGFVGVRRKIREMRPVPAVCVLGVAPDPGSVPGVPADPGSNACRTERSEPQGSPMNGDARPLAHEDAGGVGVVDGTNHPKSPGPRQAVDACGQPIAPPDRPWS